MYNGTCYISKGPVTNNFNKSEIQSWTSHLTDTVQAEAKQLIERVQNTPTPTLTPYSPAMTQGSYSILKIDIDFWTQFLKEDLHEGNRVVHICKVCKVTLILVLLRDRTSATESVSNPEWLGWEMINKQTYFYLLPFLFY